MDGAPSDDSDSLAAMEVFYPPRILLTITPKDGIPQRPLKCQLEIEGTTQCRFAFMLNLHPPSTTKKLTEKTTQGMRACIYN